MIVLAWMLWWILVGWVGFDLILRDGEQRLDRLTLFVLFDLLVGVSFVCFGWLLLISLLDLDLLVCCVVFLVSGLFMCFAQIS